MWDGEVRTAKGSNKDHARFYWCIRLPGGDPKHPSSPSQSPTNILLWPQNLEIPQINRSLSKKKRICWHNAFEKAIKQRDVVGSIASRKTGAYPPRKISRFVHERTWTIYIYIYIFVRRLGKKRGPSNVAQRANKNREALHILTLVFKFIWPVKRNKPLTLPKERTKTERFLYILTLVF